MAPCFLETHRFYRHARLPLIYIAHAAIQWPPFVELCLQKSETLHALHHETVLHNTTTFHNGAVLALAPLKIHTQLPISGLKLGRASNRESRPAIMLEADMHKRRRPILPTLGTLLSPPPSIAVCLISIGPMKGGGYLAVLSLS